VSDALLHVLVMLSNLVHNTCFIHWLYLQGTETAIASEDSCLRPVMSDAWLHVLVILTNSVHYTCGVHLLHTCRALSGRLPARTARLARSV
jgi:hypothetical protein